MDLRIVNTCNNDCLFCLEQAYRKKTKFIKKEKIFEILQKEENKEILCFYGWNPFLHPDLEEIIIFAKIIWFKNISLLTNTFWVEENFLKNLQKSWLSWISFYFNSFSEEKQKFLTNSQNSVKNLLKNILLLKKNNFNIKCVIHLNNQNIEEILKDILILNQKFWIKNFEFVKYHIVSRAKNFKEFLEFDREKEKIFLEKIEKISKKLNLQISFKKF